MEGFSDSAVVIGHLNYHLDLRLEGSLNAADPIRQNTERDLNGKEQWKLPRIVSSSGRRRRKLNSWYYYYCPQEVVVPAPFKCH